MSASVSRVPHINIPYLDTPIIEQVGLAVSLWTHIREMLGSNPEQDIGSSRYTSVPPD
jgi:hypothetical protein